MPNEPFANHHQKISEMDAEAEAALMERTKLRCPRCPAKFIRGHDFNRHLEREHPKATARTDFVK